MQLLSLDNERLIHSFKTAFACLVGFAITKSVHFYFDQWLIITILVVMCAQINVGSMLQKSYMRFLGTLAGSIIAAIILKIYGTDPIPIAITITAAAFIFSYIATGPSTINDAGTLGVVTITIILVGKNPTLMTAFARFVEISIGILIAAIVSQFILPIHARRHLRNLQAETIRQLRSYYLATFLTNQTESEDYQELDEAIAKSLAAQRKLAADAKREPFGTAFNVNNFKKSLNCEKEILRSISFMHRAYQISPDSKILFSTVDFLPDFHKKICQALQDISNCIEQRISAKDKIFLPSIQLIKNAIDSTRSHSQVTDIIYVNSFLFCAEILIDELTQLVELVAEVNT